MKQYNIEPIKNSLETISNILVLLPQNPSIDTVAAGLSIFLSFTQTQKNISIGCASEMTVNFNRLFGVDKIKSHIGNQNLIISFDYQNSDLEKVSHDETADGRFFLTIEPKAGSKPVDPHSVKFSYNGSTADLIFIINARSLEDLGPLYQQEKTLLDDQQKTLVNLSALAKNSQFGTVNLYDPTAAGASEIVLNLLKSLNLPFKQDIATNLLAGIESSTNNLASASSPDTYETIAELIRSGAKKGYLSSQTPISSINSQAYQPQPFSSQSSLASRRLPKFWPKASQPMAKTNILPKPVSSISQPDLGSGKPMFNNAPSVAPVQAPTTQATVSSNQPKPDWLKPKVITSSGVKI